MPPLIFFRGEAIEYRHPRCLMDFLIGQEGQPLIATPRMGLEMGGRRFVGPGACDVTLIADEQDPGQSKFSDEQGMLRRFERSAERVVGYERRGHRIIGLDVDQKAAFVVELAPQDGLEYRRWRVVAFRAGGQLRPSPEEFYATPFFVDGGIEGSSGCGGLGGQYLKSGRSITIEVGSVLGGYCDPRESQLAACVIGALNQAKTVNVQEDRAEFRDERGRVQIVLEAWPAHRMNARLSVPIGAVSFQCPWAQS